MSASHCSSVTSVVTRKSCRPALLTSTSRRPYASTVAATAARQSAADVTSSGAEPDFARQVGAGRGNLGELRLVPRGGVDEATGGGEPADGSGTES